MFSLKSAVRETKATPFLGGKVHPIGPGWSNACILGPTQKSSVFLKAAFLAIWLKSSWGVGVGVGDAVHV